MRAALLFLTGSTLVTVEAQTSIGLFVGPWTDPVFGTNSIGAGGLVEHRIADSLNLVLRISAEQHWCAGQHTHYTSDDTATGQVARRFERDVQTRYTRWMLHAKLPLTSEECSDGFFRGAYALIGAGYALGSISSRSTAVDVLHGTSAYVNTDEKLEA